MLCRGRSAGSSSLHVPASAVLGATMRTRVPGFFGSPRHSVVNFAPLAALRLQDPAARRPGGPEPLTPLGQRVG